MGKPKIVLVNQPFTLSILKLSVVNTVEAMTEESEINWYHVKSNKRKTQPKAYSPEETLEWLHSKFYQVKDEFLSNEHLTGIREKVFVCLKNVPKLCSLTIGFWLSLFCSWCTIY